MLWTLEREIRWLSMRSLKATKVVQQRLFASAKPETQAEIRRVLAKVSHEVAAKAAPPRPPLRRRAPTVGEHNAEILPD